MRRCLMSLLVIVGCAAAEDGGRGGAPDRTPAGSGGGGGAGVGGQAGGQPLPTPVDPETCFTGQLCDGGQGVCADGACCPAARACGDSCCDGEEICAFGKCLSPGDECLQADDCRDGEYCELAFAMTNAPAELPDPELGCDDRPVPPKGRCLPRPDMCTDEEGEDCLKECEWIPEPSEFSPTVIYSWGQDIDAFTSDIMMTPIVVQLDDDDCDGEITARDIPEIVFTTDNDDTLRVVSIEHGVVVDKWAFAGVKGNSHLAGGNVDGEPGNEVVACAADGTVVAVRGDGTELWRSAAIAPCTHPALADLDSDGVPEVVVAGGILDGATGNLENAFVPKMIGTFAISDIDGDAALDIVSSGQAYHADGIQFIDVGRTIAFPANARSGPAVADLDLDGKPEVIAVERNKHQLLIWRHAPGGFEIVRSDLDINGTLDPKRCNGNAGETTGGGAVTVGDFNGDGVPDVALAGGVGYAVFDGKKLMDPAVDGPDTFLWVKQTTDCSSATTGSSLFDFNGDDRAEVVYADELYLYIYEGATGDLLFQTCNTSGTVTENPIVADVDNDGQADLVVAANAERAYTSDNYKPCEGGGQSGIRVFGSAAGEWVRTRPIWNQHAYHVTNVEDDGSIPAQEKPNWLEPDLNNFRMNLQPGGVFAAPDAIVSLLTVGCGKEYVLTATVTNMGASVLPAGVTVEFVLGEPPGGDVLGSATTLNALFPLQSEKVVFALKDPPDEFVNGDAPVHARVVGDGSVHECHEDNNASEPVSGQCALQ